MIVSMDFETRGTLDLKKTGVGPYAKHPNTDVWCLCFTRPSDPSGIDVWTSGDTPPGELVAHVLNGGKISAWNVVFEWHIWNSILVPRYGFPPLPFDQCVCTMTMALARAYPGSLDAAAKAMRTGIPKDAAGSRLMLSMCRPRRIETDGTVVWWTDPERIERLIEYCRQDVRAEVAILKLLPPLIPSEEFHFRLTHEINQRGIHVDMALVDGAERVIAARMADLNKEIRQITGGCMTSTTNVAKIRNWLGLLIEDMPDTLDKNDIRNLLARDDLDPRARRVLEIRSEAGKSSTKKINAFKHRVDADSRIRDVFKFLGAGSTGRYTSGGVQVQNLTRAAVKPAGVLDLITQGDMLGVDLFNQNGGVMNAVSAAIRPMLTATPGRILLICDFGQIESRLTAWLARDENKLDVFRQDRDVYQQVGSGMYGIPEDQVVGEIRQSSKVAELACGFAGGKGALQQMAAAYGIEWDEIECQEIVDRWRLANPLAVELWKDLMAAIHQAMQNPGTNIRAAGGRLVYKYADGSLRCLLPSGRVINYPWASLGKATPPWDDTAKIDVVQYEGFNSARQWTTRVLWRGLATENVIQAMASDILRYALENLNQEGFEVVLHCHDEIVCEVDDPERLADMRSIMTRVPPWAEGLPLAASAEASFRYNK